MNFISLSYLIPLFPLIGAAVNGFISFVGAKNSRRVTNITAVGSMSLSFLLTIACLYNLAILEPAARSVTVGMFSWIDSSPLKVNAGLLIDPLSILMALVVTGVGLLIHIYSTGYMRTDPGYARFFSYLNLFCFAMLMLVLAENLLLMFVGWEGVGLCSYLLIGFWFEQKPNAVAGMKAFIVNRIGDFGFIIGVIILFWATFKIGSPTMSFTELKAIAPQLGALTIGHLPLVTLVCLLLFFGATGKSAQIPLYVWLPDAMAGPTPVSALIHAATMVTAGVYMMGRLNFLYTMSPVALTIVATVGTFTALFAATIAFAQDDIKKILAYSTISQLGYMFLGMGTGIYASGIFHLVTHAFFKACLFLGAGSVIIAMHHEQNIKRMGGLRRHMRETFWSFLAATLALAGIFPLSGFFSKDEILWQVFVRANTSHWYYVLWAMGLAGALATAFYMMRCVSLVFLGRLERGMEFELTEADALEKKRRVDPHYQPFVPTTPPLVMVRVVSILAVLALIGGFLGMPHSIGSHIGIHNFIGGWLLSVFPKTPETGYALSVEYILMSVSVGTATLGIVSAVWLYTKKMELIRKFTATFKRFYELVLNKYYIDELYELLFVKRLLIINAAAKWFDEHIIDALVNLTGHFGVLWSRLSGWLDDVFVDGAVNLVADATISSGKKLRMIQTGRIQHYFYIALVGLLAVFVWRTLL